MTKRAFKANLKQRVTTRLAWLMISQKSFAQAIGMDKSVLSRAIRVNSPRKHTLESIATGLAISAESLISEEDRLVLLSDHPGLKPGMTQAERTEAISEWYSAHRAPIDRDKKSGHRSSDDRYARRKDVREAIACGSLNLEKIRFLAKKHEVSTSQIHSDRSVLLNLEPGLMDLK